MFTAGMDSAEIGGWIPMKPAARRLGEYIREIRQAKQREDASFSVEGVARRLNWPTSKYRQVEVSRVTMIEPEDLRAIAYVLEVDPDELLAAAGYLEFAGSPA